MSIQSTGLSHWESSPPPITVSFQMAKKLSGLGLTKLWELAKEGRIEVVHVGRRTLITMRSLEALLTPRTASEPEQRRRGRPRKSSMAERMA
jgi:hypothetical protein